MKSFLKYGEIVGSRLLHARRAEYIYITQTMT